MLSNSSTTSARAAIETGAATLLAAQLHALRRQIDRLFVVLLLLQWIVAVGLALWYSPYSYTGGERRVHIHVLASLLLGALITLPPVGLTLRCSGTALTRQAIATCQMVWSALLIHITGGRIETHFHVFGSLAFLAAYRDWKVLLTATGVVVLDHGVRGWLWPQFVYGVPIDASWRFLEHGFWVLFEDVFLFAAIRQANGEMRQSCRRAAELERQNDLVEAEVDRRTEQLREARDREEQASQTKSEFLARMSHEIRTPMTAIIGFADVLLDQAQQKSEREAAQIIKRNGEALLEIINDVLDLSKIEAGKLSCEIVECSVTELAADVVSLLRIRAEAKGVALRLELDQSLPARVLSDPFRIRQVLVNFLSNAIKFTERGEIFVSVTDRKSASGRLLEFTVRDTGIGMSPTQLENLFSPYSQGDPSTARRYGGTGLGLSICKRLAGLLDGQIEVESSLGVGSLFRLLVPAVEVETPELSEISQGLPTAPVELSDCRVLLVEDSPDVQRLLGFLLRKAGADVATADDGDQAISMALRNFYDIVLMDVQMPVLDGLEACRQLRAAGYHRPVIALTADAMEGARAACLAAGYDDYLSKPIAPPTLLATVRRFLPLSATSAAV